MIEAVTISGTAQEIIEYLQSRGHTKTTYFLTRDPSPQEPATIKETLLSPQEEEGLFDEVGEIGKHRLRADLTYSREDIYFDR